MKKLLALAALLVASTSFAINSSSSWDEIKAEVKANHKLTMTQGVVFIGRPISAFDACINGDEFNTTREFPIYENVYVGKGHDHDGNKDGYVTKLVDRRILSYPMNYETTVKKCHNDKNCKYVTKTVNQDDVKTIAVKKLIRKNNDKAVYKTLFTKKYYIPACN